MSLDVIYHPVEDQVFNDHMEALFSAAHRFVIIYSSNYDEPEDQRTGADVRHRKFTDWVDENMAPSWKQVEFVANDFPFVPSDPDNTSLADFYVFRAEGEPSLQN